MAPAARKRALITVAFALFLDLMAFGMILPVLPYYAESHGASAAVVALLSTAFSLAQFIMAPVLGRWSDRYGRRPVMLISIGGSVVSALVLGFANALWVVFAARVFSGISKANVSTAHAYVSDIVEPSQRARYMGMMGAALGMGFVFGPAVGGLLSFESMPTLPFFAAAGLNVLNLIMAFVWLPESNLDRGEGQERRRKGLGPVLEKMRGRAFGTLVIMTFVYFMAFAAMESTFALFTEHEFSWGPKETGMFLTLMGLAIAIAQGILVGRVVDRWGEARTLMAGITALACGLGLTGLLPHLEAWLGLQLVGPDGGVTLVAVGLFAACAIGIALGNGLSMAPISALVSRTSEPHEVGFNMGVKESSSALARITGPVVAGTLFEVFEPSAPMLAGAAFCVLNLMLAAGLRRRLRAEGRGGDGPE
jgi:multidrug resistance protein